MTEAVGEAAEKGPRLPAGGSYSPNLRLRLASLALEEFRTRDGYDTLMPIPSCEVQSACVRGSKVRSSRGACGCE